MVRTVAVSLVLIFLSESAMSEFLNRRDEAKLALKRMEGQHHRVETWREKVKGGLTLTFIVLDIVLNRKAELERG